MRAKTIKVLATVVILVGAIGGMLYTTLAEGTEYYKHVDEVMADPAPWHDKKLQLHGFIVEKSLMRKPGTLEYIFKIQNNGHVVDARYTGLIPDNLKDNAEVVVKGHLGPDGFAVEPGGIMAKCPSKYEAAPPRTLGT